MGLDRAGTLFLARCAATGINARTTATIGRQSLTTTRSELEQALAIVGLADQAASLLDKAAGWAEPLLRVFGAEQVDSFDVSAFEGATQLVDMNLPLPERFHERYSLVIDGGSLEHIFEV